MLLACCKYALLLHPPVPNTLLLVRTRVLLIRVTLLRYKYFVFDFRHEDAFHKVLGLEDVGRLSWLCRQLDPGTILSQNLPKLSQQLLLPLIQQLGFDLLEVS